MRGGTRERKRAALVDCFEGALLSFSLFFTLISSLAFAFFSFPRAGGSIERSGSPPQSEKADRTR